MTDQDPPATGGRRRKLATRQRRTRIVGAVVAIALIALGTGTAMAVRNNGDTPAAPVDRVAPAKGKRPAPDSTIATRKLRPPRPISHADPLRLWIGGDSLSGSFGPALGQTGGATGVVDARIDYKVSSGLEDLGIRNWPEHATQEMATYDPDHVVFIIGANDASIVNTYDSNGDGVPDWQVAYREKIHRMMDILVGGSRHRIVYWLGPPTMGDQSLNKGAYELGRLMRSEAGKFAPDVTYVDTYRLFADANGDYSRSLPDGHGEILQMRISDGVHFSVDGAKYLADRLWAKINQRWHVTAQADPSQPISYTIAEGSNDYVPGVGRYRPTVPSQSSDTTPASVDPTTTIAVAPSTTPATKPVPTTTQPVATTTKPAVATTTKPVGPPISTP
ncbi:MAG: uncharacterized protein QOH10_1047 [Actinomycetota bacterium]|nr:uncharacterized protein [Actinomycetota bacterium]